MDCASVMNESATQPNDSTINVAVGGIAFAKAKSETAVPYWAISEARLPPDISIEMAALPNTPNHAMAKSAGAIMFTRTNCLMVRPFDSLTKKSPTNGANESHQAQ